MTRFFSAVDIGYLRRAFRSPAQAAGEALVPSLSAERACESTDRIRYMPEQEDTTLTIICRCPGNQHRSDERNHAHVRKHGQKGVPGLKSVTDSIAAGRIKTAAPIPHP